MGAFITHYYANIKTVVAYTVTTTSLGPGAETKSALPDLKLIMGNSELPVVYTHTLEVSHENGPELDHATLGIKVSDVPGHVQALGNILAYGPDPVHKITCEPFDTKNQSVVCGIGQISSTIKPYRVVMATDQRADIVLTMDAKNTRIQRAEGAQRDKLLDDKNQLLFFTSLIVLVMVIMMVAMMAMMRSGISVVTRAPRQPIKDRL